MSHDPDASIPTRQSLLRRLRDWGDQRSWQEFFDTYWRLLHGVARQAGLTQAEAEDAVQETILSAAKGLAKFKIDPACGSFKQWLLQITRRRIADQFRKRLFPGQPLAASPQDDSRTATIERVPDPASLVRETVWEEQWQRNQTEVAMERVKNRISPKQWIIFQHLVQKEWPPRQVATSCGVSLAQVYVAKHRVTALIKQEVRRLGRMPGPGPDRGGPLLCGRARLGSGLRAATDLELPKTGGRE